jgi:eukaryotic-like serine/threonine-protein kinase
MQDQVDRTAVEESELVESDDRRESDNSPPGADRRVLDAGASPSTERPPLGLWQELKQRRLFPIMASYAAIGWVALEVVDSLTGRDVLPDIVFTIGMTWYLAGIAAVAVIGWFHGERGDQVAPKGEIAFLTVLTMAVLTVNGFTYKEFRADRLARDAAAAGTLDLHRIAVLYFEDVGDGEEQYLADALTEELIGELAQVRALDVVSRNGVAPFRGGLAAPDSVAHVLRAGTVVGGTIQRRGDRMRVDIQLIDGASGAEFRRAGFDHPVADLQGLGEAVAEQAGQVLRAWLGEEVRLRATRRATSDMAAWSQYQRAEKRRKDAVALLRRDDQAGALAAMEEADTLAARAETLDPLWPAPSVLRAEVALMRAVRDQDPETPYLDMALSHVDRALQRAPRDASALEMRGTIRLRRYYRPGTLEPARRTEVLNAARADLEEAVRLDPTRASAFVMLSNLYYETDLSSAVLAGRRAYEEDAYLDNANIVVSRLFWGSMDLQQFGEATRWCEEGRERFPGDARFALCPIVLMATPAREPDVDAAWELVAVVDSLAMPTRRDFERVRATIYTAAAIARAGLPDSAYAVLARVESEIPGADPTQGLFAASAYPYVLLGDHDRAVGNYKRYLLVNPQHGFKPDREIGWWWAPLRSHPRFNELLARE